MGVPGSNPGGPIIFRRKIEGRQSNTAGGERGLGQWWVFGGQYPGGPIILTACKPILADGVREVGALPDFSVRYGRAI